MCHDGGVARAPDKGTRWANLSPERIDFALSYGLMNQQARDLSQREIAALVRYLKGTSPPVVAALPDSSCHDPGPGPERSVAAALEWLGRRHQAASLSAG